jgi:hypothetical protein
MDVSQSAGAGVMRRAMLSVALGAMAVTGAARVTRAQTHLVIVSGLGGEKRYSTEFNEIASQLAEAGQKRWGIADGEDIWLGEDSVAAGKPHYGGQSTKANVEQTLIKLAARAGPGDQVVLVLIGHGSGEGEDTARSCPTRKSRRSRRIGAGRASPNTSTRSPRSPRKGWASASTTN